MKKMIDAGELIGWLDNQILFAENERKYQLEVKDKLIRERVGMLHGGEGVDKSELAGNTENWHRADFMMGAADAEIRAFGNTRMKVEQLMGQSGGEKGKGE